MDDHQEEEYDAAAHARYFKMCLKILPGQMQAPLDVNRMTIVYFALAGLDLIGKLDVLTDKTKQEYIEWIYSQQVLKNEECNVVAGFRGGPWLGVKNDDPKHPWDASHITHTYCALVSLIILGDTQLSRVHRKDIAMSLGQYQNEDGSFRSVVVDGETDMRFIFCACMVAYVLNDWSGIDKDKTTAFIAKCINYDCAFGQGPGLESHGGSTFCSLAALELMGTLDTVVTSNIKPRLTSWLLNRQQSGFNGRPNKLVDVCYSFWVGASIKIIGAYDLIDKTAQRQSIMASQQPSGGFSKVPDAYADPMHSYMGLCGLSMLGTDGILPLNPALNISKSTGDKFPFR